MPLVFKLVGSNDTNKFMEIKDDFEGSVSLKLFMELFIFWGITDDELKQIKFIIDSEHIKNEDKEYIVKATDEKIIFVFTSCQELRNKLKEVFIKNGVKEKIQEPVLNQIDSDIIKSVTEILPDIQPVLTDDIINAMNLKSIKLFSDPDFKFLINIFIKKPELFSTFSQYVQNGDIIKESILKSKHKDTEQYKSLANYIHDLNIDISYDIIMDRLIKMNGHLNLTLRSLLCEKALL
jgi:hypothetical protein